MSSSSNKMSSGPRKDCPRNCKLVAPTHHNWHQRHRSNSAEAQETCGTLIVWTSPWEERCQFLLARSKMENWPIGQDTGLVEAMAQHVSATASVIELASPIVPPDQTEEERQYMLVVTALVRRLNLETTGAILRDTVTTSAGGVAFQNPHMAAVLSRPIQEIRVIGNRAPLCSNWEGKMWSENALKDLLMTAFGQKGRLMTTFGQKDCDVIWQEQSHTLGYSSYMPQQLSVFAGWMGPCSPSLCCHSYW